MPFQPYVTLAEAKAWLGESDSSNDAAIQAAIAGATGQIIAFLGVDRGLGEATEIITPNARGSRYLFPKRRPIVSIGALSVIDTGQVIPLTELWSDAQVVRWKAGGFYPENPVSLTYTAGFAATSDEWQAIKAAAKITTQALYGAFAADPNLQGESMPGVSASYAPNGPGALPVAAQNILQPYRSVY